MKRFEGILICTDLDGTLLKNDYSISSENREAIEYFKAEGGYFTFITGRMPYFARDSYERVSPNAPVGCINGGGIYDYAAGKYVYTKELPRDVLELVAYVEREMPEMGIQVNTFERIYFHNDNVAMEMFRHVTKTPALFRHYSEVDEPIAKIIFSEARIEQMARVAEVLAAHPRASEFSFVRSEKRLYEILPQGTHKGRVLLPLAKHLGVDPSRVIAIGDYDNDVGMLRDAAIGVAVANASPAALAAADRVTVSNQEHAIARLISDIESGAIAF